MLSGINNRKNYKNLLFVIILYIAFNSHFLLDGKRQKGSKLLVEFIRMFFKVKVQF
jgi:hypothetical protein